MDLFFDPTGRILPFLKPSRYLNSLNMDNSWPPYISYSPEITELPSVTKWPPQSTLLGANQFIQGQIALLTQHRTTAWTPSLSQAHQLSPERLEKIVENATQLQRFTVRRSLKNDALCRKKNF
ncbi:uncharacterized protein LOC129751014 [Uranotaenia lowii]|uniref:uncharacterized protein LOC129751014 n=1 Tax=Uranotaenia lowii TaxID=190385 RepID=UPI0024788180|nr:uncharacterized protein LOC129751014 [Uranotaenia lowii]